MKILTIENSSAIGKQLLTLLAASGNYQGVGYTTTTMPAAKPALLRSHGLTLPVSMLSASGGEQYRAAPASPGR